MFNSLNWEKEGKLTPPGKRVYQSLEFSALISKSYNKYFVKSCEHCSQKLLQVVNVISRSVL